MNAKEFLIRVAKLDALIQNKLIEKQQWMDMALGITAHMDGDRVQSSGAKSRMAEAVEKCVDMEGEINTLIDRLIDTRREVLAVIEQVDSPVEYDVLHRRYIQKLDLQDIADAYGMEYGWATTTHGRALKSVQTILDGREKT